jgi:lysophospholipase L1-like esterase
VIRTRLFASLCIVLAGVAGCNDATIPTAAPPLSAPDANAAANIFARNTKFVSIGTSVSMGWQSDGVYEATQIVSWPALLELGNLHPMSLPLISAPGCQSPLVAPLAAGKRLSGESAFGSTVCAPNRSGVVLPTQNVAIAGALAVDAVSTTPEVGAAARPWYRRVLPPGTTQLSAALAQHPTFVSVELGANEVLGAITGRVVPFVTVVPFPGFSAPYDLLLNTLGATHVQALLVGLPSDARNFPALRRGDEIWADRLAFSALNVAVSPDCDGSPNYINVAVKVLGTVFAASQSPLPVPFSCADIPGAEDDVLTPEDIAVINAMLAQMTAHIRTEAAARHYAYASLGALYDRADLKGGAYSVQKQLTSPLPYGVFMSLDGVHPNALGHLVIAAAAARGINDTYRFGAALARSPAAGGALGIR